MLNTYLPFEQRREIFVRQYLQVNEARGKAHTAERTVRFIVDSRYRFVCFNGIDDCRHAESARRFEENLRFFSIDFSDTFIVEQFC